MSGRLFLAAHQVGLPDPAGNLFVQLRCIGDTQEMYVGVRVDSFDLVES